MKQTKKQLEAKVEELQNKNEQLQKDNMTLKARLEFYESLPAQAQKVCTDAWCGLMNFVQGQGQQQK